jgi:membrane protein implicated in regulation of membrane protease activity
VRCVKVVVVLGLVVLTIVAWLAVSVVVAFAFGRALQRRDRAEPGSAAHPR